MRVEWHCNVERPSNLRTEELGRCHPDNRERDAFDDERRANDVGVPTETPLPHPIADDRHRTIRSATTHIVGGRKRATKKRWHAKRREEIAADVRAIDRLHLSAGRREIQPVLITGCRPRDGAIEHLRCAPPDLLKQVVAPCVCISSAR